jgi:hypothetical protein
MSNLSTKVKLYLQANGKTGEEMGVPHEPNTKVIITKDGNTPEKIEKWNVDGLEQPTTSQLDALESEATKLENNNKAIRNRLSEYPSLGDIVDSIFKKEAGDSTEFDSLATKRQATKIKYAKE